jgi:hypothetical protein
MPTIEGSPGGPFPGAQLPGVRSENDHRRGHCAPQWIAGASRRPGPGVAMAEGLPMPIRAFLKGEQFDRETLRVLGVARSADERLVGFRRAMSLMQRRGRLMTGTPQSRAGVRVGENESAEPSIATKAPSEPRRPAQLNAALTQGQVNAVRAAFKAGIAPSRIARQFGISQSDVRKVLGSEFRAPKTER